MRRPKENKEWVFRVENKRYEWDGGERGQSVIEKPEAAATTPYTYATVGERGGGG